MATTKRRQAWIVVNDFTAPPFYLTSLIAAPPPGCSFEAREALVYLRRRAAARVVRDYLRHAGHGWRVVPVYVHG